MVLKFSYLKQLDALMTSRKLLVNWLETGCVINDQSLASLVWKWKPSKLHQAQLA